MTARGRKTRSARPAPRRRASAAALTAVAMTALIGFAALAIDIGMLYNVRTELQRTADAAALAGAAKIIDFDSLQGTSDMSEEVVAVRQVVQSIAGANPVLRTNPQVAVGDIQLGFMNDVNKGFTQPIDFGSPAKYNTVQVVVRRDAAANGPVPLIFARILGRNTATVTALAAAAVMDGAVGFHVTHETGTSKLMPIALHVDSWNNLINHGTGTGDEYSYDPVSKNVIPGQDGIFELNLFPGGGAEQLPPGNCGTVDIGAPDNSSSELSRQIQDGVNDADLAFFGGELKLGPDGTLTLTGDTGLSACTKDDLEAVVGEGRIIPLFREVIDPGNNAIFTIVGFAGIRIVNVKLTGAMDKKEVIVQPAVVFDNSVITETTSGPSFYVYAPPRLVR